MMGQAKFRQKAMIAAIQGLLASGYDYDNQELVDTAIKLADALVLANTISGVENLKELDEDETGCVDDDEDDDEDNPFEYRGPKA